MYLRILNCSYYNTNTLINMEGTASIIQPQQVFDSLEKAIQYLNKDINHKIGQIVSLTYKQKTPGDIPNSMGNLLAIGIQSGKGNLSYSIISTGDTILISGIVDGKVDVSLLVTSGSIYICRVNGIYYWTFLKDNEVMLVEIINTVPVLVKNISNGNYYWIKQNSITECFDHPSEEAFNTLRNNVKSVLNLGSVVTSNTNKIEALMSKVFQFEVNINPIDNPIIDLDGNTIDTFRVEIYSGFRGNIVDNKDCDYFVNEEAAEFDEYGYLLIRPNYSSGVPGQQVFKITSKYKLDNTKIDGKELILYYTYKSIIGKIITTDGTGELMNWDKALLTKVLNGEESASIEIISSSLSIWEKSSILSTSYKLNEYTFCAVPKIIGSTEFRLDDIRDLSGGFSLFFEYACYEDIPLTGSTGKKFNYRVYVKKTPINSKGNLLTTEFIP